MEEKTIVPVPTRLIRIDASGCWIWTGDIDGYGYGRISVGGKKLLAHRMMFALFGGRIPAMRVAMHTCDNPPCVNPEHIKIGTQRENLEDMRSKGRGKYGYGFSVDGKPLGPTDHGRRGEHMLKYPAETIRAVRDDIEAGMSQSAAARKHGISISYASRIGRGLWRRDI